MNYKEDLILVHEEVPAGETVWNGFIGGQTTCTAPKEEGYYDLYEAVDENNNHIKWVWIKI